MIRNLDLFRNTLSLANLGSGSKGNATVVASQGSAVLVDCGLSCKQIRKRMTAVGMDPKRLDGIVITHEHADHVAGIAVTARQLGIPIHATERAGEKLRKRGRLGDGVEIRSFVPGRPFQVGELKIDAFRISHDAIDPVGYVIALGQDRVGLATDMGAPSPQVVEALRSCRAVLLEFNHDLDLLLHGEYPWHLKQRVRSRLGHLSNAQAAAVVRELRQGKVEELVIGHISEANNTPELALHAAREAVGTRARGRIRVHLARQDEPGELLHLT
jgi:phosphoribosyl 1,2-cyclic phosphodiesterase